MQKVVITNIPFRYYSCYQWLILGFHELAREKRIRFKIKLPFKQKLLCNRFATYILFKLKRFPQDISNCLIGYVQNDSGAITRFAYDVADSPFSFEQDVLEHVDCYFKAQCPREFDFDKGFELAPDVYIPYKSYVHDNIHKIFPAMLGVRRIGDFLNYSSLKKGYENLMQSRVSHKTAKLTAYFGNTRGPVPAENVNFSSAAELNYDSEKEILGFFKDKLHHPNEKRAKAVELLKHMGEGFDARVINEGNADGQPDQINTHLIVPLKDFSRFVANFEYNLNISGFRMSIPNRFIDSFIVGTAIITDRLSVKWYLPFDDEVIETVPMGYIPEDKVDWELFERDIKLLRPLEQQAIIDLYERKWAPKVFAGYVLDKCLAVN